MKQVLYIDCCVRGQQSRTKQLADAFFAALPEGYQVTRLDLMTEGLQPLMPDALAERDALLAAQETDHPRFRYAHQIAQADLVVMAAPFWDLSYPAMLKVYIENVSVEGLTFRSTEHGLEGLCKGQDLVFLTTRGGIYPQGSELEQATPYLSALKKFFGFDRFHYIAAEGLDIFGYDADGALAQACAQAADLAKSL